MQLLKELLDLNEAQWSADVKTKKSAPAGLFATGTAAEIAKWALSSHADMKSAVAALTFYKNRGGKNLDAAQQAKIDAAIASVERSAKK